MDMENENRLKLLRTHLNLTQKQMAAILDIGQNSYSRIENGITAFKDTYKKLLEEKYHLTVGWLSGADGPMFRVADPIAGLYRTSIPNSNKKKLKEKILDELVDNRLYQQYSENEAPQLPPIDNIQSNTFVPLIPLAAQAGRLNDFVDSIKSIDCEKVISPIRGAEFAITVTGDSMSPEYPSGTQVLIKKINEKAFIDWGRVYVLDTCNGIVIKKIMPTLDENRVKCVSINPEYPPFEVSLQDIFGLYRVLLSMSLK